jgi:diacylglycerol kinase (ATP)
VAVIIACWLDVDAITRVLLIGSVLLVMIVEILNSAIEAVVDRIGSDFMSFLGAQKTWGLRRCCWRLSRRDHLGHAALVTFPMSLEE